MASLRARSRLHAGSLEVINKVLSLSGFLILMAAGWVALCYVRSSLERRSSNSAHTTEAGVAQAPIQPQIQPSVRLVYSAPDDKVYYHNPNHVPGKGERSALSEEAARSLGLRPCPVCIHREIQSQSPTGIERRGASESPK